jgi:hypothetical protein
MKMKGWEHNSSRLAPARTKKMMPRKHEDERGGTQQPPPAARTKKMMPRKHEDEMGGTQQPPPARTKRMMPRKHA